METGGRLKEMGVGVRGKGRDNERWEIKEMRGEGGNGE